MWPFTNFWQPGLEQIAPGHHDGRSSGGSSHASRSAFSTAAIIAAASHRASALSLGEVIDISMKENTF